MIVSSSFLIAIIAISFIVGHVQNDLINPAFSDMMRYFSTNPTKFHLMSSSCSFGSAIACLIFGPLSEFYGRKNVLLTGFFLLMLGLVGCIFASSIDLLIFWRFIEGAGMSASVTICVVLVFDLFDRKKSSQLTGIYDGIITASKSLAPIIGGYLNIYFGWKSGFIVLIFLTLIAFLLNYIYLTEPKKLRKNKKFSITILVRSYLNLIRSKIFMLYAIKLGLMACAMIVYLASISLIFTDYLKVSKYYYGYYVSSTMALFSIFSFLTAIFIEYFGLKATKMIGLVLIVLGGCLFVFVAYNSESALYISLSMAICSSGFALLIAIFMHDAMNVLPDLKGYASALIASIRLALIAIFIALAGLFFNGSIKPIAIIVFFLVILVVMINLLIATSNKYANNKIHN